MTLKEEVYIQCLKVITDKVVLLQKTLTDLKESAANETKSTAGDKHETALAMLQIEQANIGVQLTEAMLQKQQLEKIGSEKKAVKITKGSLVKTNRAYFFVSIAVGRMNLNDRSIIALSPLSPLGKKLVEANTGDEIEVNGLKYVIEGFE